MSSSAVSDRARSIRATAVRVLAIMVVALLAGVTAALFVESNQPQPRPTAWVEEGWYTALLIAAFSAIALVTIVFLLLGTIRFITTPWRSPPERGLGHQRALVAALVMLAAVLIVLHWDAGTWASFRRLSPSDLSMDSLDRLRALLAAGAWQDVLILPLSLIPAVLNFLPYVILAGLVTVLQAAGRADTELFFLRASWAWRLLAVIFAGFRQRPRMVSAACTSGARTVRDAGLAVGVTASAAVVIGGPVSIAGRAGGLEGGAERA
jgi:hypothetical protein